MKQGGSAQVTVPAYKTSFTLTISSWDWLSYTQAQFETFKTALKGYIAKALGCLTSQVTITWTYQGSTRRRLVLCVLCFIGFFLFCLRLSF